MNDWRSGLLLRTFQRLALRLPFVVVLMAGFGWFALATPTFWLNVAMPEAGAPDDPKATFILLMIIVATAVALAMCTIAAMRRPLWERHAIGLLGLIRGTLFGLLVLSVCLVVGTIVIVGVERAAPFGETPHAFSFLHRSGLIAILLLCTSPGLFALVVSVRERQGYSTVARIWRIDRAQTIRGVFLIMVLTTCVAAVAIVGSSIALRGMQVAALWLGTESEWIAALNRPQRAGLTSVFTIIAFTTAHIVQYERIRDWESGGDVTGVFD